MNDYIIVFTLAFSGIVVLCVVGVLLNAGYMSVAFGALLVGIVTPYAGDLTTGRVLRYMNIYLASAFGIIVSILILGYLFDLSPYGNAVVTAIAIAESFIIVVVIRYIVLLRTIWWYRRYLTKLTKGLYGIERDHSCSPIVQCVEDLVAGIREGLSMFLREEYEHAIIHIVGAIEKFLRNLKSLGIVEEGGSFAKTIRKLLEEYNRDNDEIGRMLKEESTRIYSLRSKYAHGDIVELVSRDVKWKLYELNQFFKYIERVFKYRLAVFETLAVIVYSYVFVNRAIEILTQHCPALKQIVS